MKKTTSIKTVDFSSWFDEVHRFEDQSQEIIRRERAVFAATPEFARKAGPIHDMVMDFVRDLWKGEKVVVDSRVQQLMRGWYPSIPGWHLDDLPRPTRNGQPEWRRPSYVSEHLAVIFGDCSRTQFLKAEISLPIPEDGQRVYSLWHDAIEKLKDLDIRLASDAHLLRFGWGSFHRAMPAEKRGWRCFIRATRHTDRPIYDDWRNQTQVYLVKEGGGW